MRLGLVGCGRLAESGYVPAVGLVPGVQVVAAADPDRGRRDVVAEAFEQQGDRRDRVDRFSTGEELVAKAGIDAVVLANPVGAHVADAALAAAAGLPVLVEKPPAPDAAGTAELEGLDPPPWIGFNRRFDPRVDGVRRRVPVAGPLVLHLELHYRRKSWRPHTVHDDVLLDLGPHLVDLARWLTGAEVVEVATATVSPQRARFDLVLERGHASVDLASDRAHREVVEVYTSDGRSIARHRRGGPFALVRGRLSFGSEPSALVASLAAQLAAFAEAVHGNAPGALGTAADGRAAMEVVDAVRASAGGDGSRVPLPPEA